MKILLFKTCFVVLLVAGAFKSNGQSDSLRIDSLKKVLLTEEEDTKKVNTLNMLSYLFRDSDYKAGLKYSDSALALSTKLDYRKGEADCILIISLLYGVNNNFIQVIQYAIKALSIYESLKDYTGIASAHLILQGDYREVQDFDKALMHEIKGEQVAESKNIQGVFVFPGHKLAPLFLAETAQTYILKDKPDSALIYVQKSIQQNEMFYGAQWGFPFYLLATIEEMQGDYIHSLQNYHLATTLAIQNNKAYDTLQIYSGMSTLFKNNGELDSSIHYAQIVKNNWRPNLSEIKNLLEAVGNLFDVYKLNGDKDSVIKYLELKYALKDSIFSIEKEKQIEGITFIEQLKQQQIISAQVKYKNKLQLYLFTAVILGLLLVSVLLIRNNKHQQKAKLKIEHAYSELQSAQAQLIQSEKMASMGELTAGIAHEIQNPLNFVNNFSEVNKELIDELQTKLKAGNNEEAIAISNDIKENEEKINHHGKRADSIVKGMLQHSRKSEGVKEPTDINALCDEYLRLAYHGLRAKDKDFNATMKTDFDESIGKINIIPQDIGRVLLNLYNNAFYAVSEKKKQQPEEYEPTISVTTKKTDNKISISVVDNGSGIPQNIVDKIFQPFFTTKPTGQGTGLGLSLSYDIVKAHGGEIKVETKEGEGSEFIIQLPVV